MRKRILSLILMILVAVCGGIFAACGEQNPDIVSLRISNGLDSNLTQNIVEDLSELLSLSESEETALVSGKGYDNNISSGNVITLIAGNEDFFTRELTFIIDGYQEGMGQLIFLSTDSSVISFSDIEYFSNGRAKVTITGLTAGTAEVQAISGQFAKKVTFTVKVLELPSSFSLKENAIIYLEKNSTLTINAENYLNFYPITTNMKEVEFYLGENLLTVDGVTRLTSVEGAENTITEDSLITVKSKRLGENQNIQSIEVRVIDSLSQIDLKKLVYIEEDNQVSQDYEIIEANNSNLTVVKNSIKTYNAGMENEFSIQYGIREVYLIVQNNETNLTMNARVYISGELSNISILPIDYELITQNSYNASIYKNIVQEYIGDSEDFSFYVYKFEFQFTGYDEYDVQFTFGVDNYTYFENRSLSVDFKDASNLINFRKSNETQEYDEYTIYDAYRGGVYGTRFIIGTNTADISYFLQITLSEDAVNNLTFLNTMGRVKNPSSSGIINFSNGENFYITGNINSAREEAYNLIVKVFYIQDGITFGLEKIIKIYIQKAPSILEFSQLSEGPEVAGVSNITEYNFDLNSSGLRIGLEGEYSVNSEIQLYLYTYDNDESLIGGAEDFIIVNNSNLITVIKDENNKITLTAKGIGSGNFAIILGNNLTETFEFEIVNSVSDFSISFPTEDQNDNVFSIRYDYEYQDTTYNNYLIALTNKAVPVIISKIGNINSLSIVCQDGTTTYTSYNNGYLKTNTDFEYKVANVNISYNYIDESNEVQTALVVADQFLLTSITNISGFNLTTNKNSNRFSIYDYSSVGYYSRELSMVSVYVNILPTNLSESFRKNVTWTTNVAGANYDNETGILTSDVFTFYSETGILICNVTDESLYNEDGTLKLGIIVLTATIDRESYGTYSSSIQFNVIKNKKIDVIVPSVDQISLDAYSNEFDLYLNVYPSTAVNRDLDFLFIPETGLDVSAINFEVINEGLVRVKLNTSNTGNGILRIIAEDSYVSSTEYTKWIDISVEISDGSEENPYQINSVYDLEKMIDTNFEKYYEISGVIDLSKTTWDYSSYILTGHITGINNAEIRGININYKNVDCLGFFKEITGSISNVKFSGIIDVDFAGYLVAPSMIYIGLLAGKNNGSLENVCVEINSGRIIAYNEYKLSIGGVVGLNTGSITTTISSDYEYTRLVYFKNYLEFIDKTFVNDKSTHTLYIGGVAGENYDGRIERIVDGDLIDFNNNFTTAEVYIKTYYYESGFASGVEAIGGVCGYSRSGINSANKGIFGVSAYGEITAGKFVSGLFYGHFDKVGGIVGDNELSVNNAISQVYVRGKNYVGGGIGINKGNVTSLIVEVLEVKTAGSYKKGLNASMIIGENFVGGLIGELNSGAVTYSSFVSYLSQRDFVSNLSTNSEEEYLGDVVIIENIDAAINFGLLFGYKPEDAGSFDYIVASGNIQFISTNVYSVVQSVSITSGSNYAIYGNFIDQNTDPIEPISIDSGLALVVDDDTLEKLYDTLEKLVDNFYTEIENQKIYNFEFVYIPTGDELGIELADQGLENQMITDTVTDPLTFYLFYYESSEDEISLKIIEESLNKVSITNYITGYHLRKCLLESSNESIIQIGNNNEFIINSTGLVKITATTPYNIELSQDFYIYVVNYTNNISAYLSSNKISNEIKAGDQLVFDATETTRIYFSFLDKNNVYSLLSPEDIQILAKVVVGEGEFQEIYLIKAGEGINEDAGFGLIRISEDEYQFIVNGKIISTYTSIIFIPYIDVEIDSKVYTTYLSVDLNNVIINEIDDIGLASEISLNGKIEFEYQLKNTTKSISLSTNEITTEPYYESNVNVILNSLNNNETLTIRIIKINPETRLIDTSFNPEWISFTARYGAGNVVQNEDADYIEITGLDVSVAENRIITVTFKYIEQYRDFNEEQVYIVTFNTSNNKSAQFTLNYNPQTAINVTTTLYDLQSSIDEQYNFPGSFSYIPSSFMIPGQSSLVEFNIIPYYTNYSKIEIVNVSTNEYNLLFDLFDRTTDTQINGERNINGGIILDRNNSGKFYLRTFLTDAITDGTSVSIIIKLLDSNGNIIGNSVTRTFYVQKLPGVRLTIDGVSSGNEESDPLKLARGLDYDIDVWVKGYTDGNLIKNGNTYIDGELVFYISNMDLVSIVKNSDGSYKLVVNKNAIVRDRAVYITTYGQRINNEGQIERSVETTIYLEINEFVVKSPEDLGDIITGVINDVYPSAVGNNYQLSISLNDNILLYDRTNSVIVNSVFNFLASLSTGFIDSDHKTSIWSYQDLSKTTTTWSKVNSANSNFIATGSENIYQYEIPNGAFILRFNKVTQDFSVVFMKKEDSSNPTFRFKYSARYNYVDGVPTLVTAASGGNELSQIFTFDIYEKTELRNPYPIYTYEDLMDMREGNYYILLNDIRLPNDFQPITTLIGGLDGNNHKIIVPNIDMSNTIEDNTLSFGLFSTTSEDAILQNIILYIEGNIRINIQYFNSVTYGLLVGTNYGEITNCAIEGDRFANVNLNFLGTSSTTTVNNEVGGLVGDNNGNISNCRVEVGISINSISSSNIGYLPANLGGIVGINRGESTLVSSYINARVENHTWASLAKTGGVVAVNETGAKIFMTYISGDYKSNVSKFADDDLTIVYSSANAGAFVYNNYGEISNCYANIKMTTSGSSSGFAYSNEESGLIDYCYSTSLVTSNVAWNSSFIGIYTGNVGEIVILNNGIINECYALEDSIYNFGIGSNEGIDYNGNGVIDDREGLQIIEAAEFDSEGKTDRTEPFVSWAFTRTSDKSDGIWFRPNSSGAESVFERNGEYMTFKAGRPELVSPNIIGAGQKEFDYSYYNEDTGTTIYKYKEVSHGEGTKYNPYIIATTDDFEVIKENAVNFIIGEHYYRIICDITYETSTLSSGLYKYSFLGNIEGNGYRIENYVLDSSEKLLNGGFFGTIGTQSNQIGSIKNLTFAPRYISLTNANAVGAVAGKAYSTTLVNIYVDGFDQSSASSGVVILGRNAVGGVVGMAFGNYSFNMVSANISVNSTYRADLNGHAIMSYTQGDYTKVSYAGLIAGILEGYGDLIYIETFGNNVSIAENASLMFGFVGKNVKAEILTVTSSSKQFIKADFYGGVIAGHSEGILKDINITDNNNRISFFANEYYIPIAIGNIVGYMTGGTIQDAVVNANLKALTGVKYLGGAVGLIKSGTLNNVIINGNITGGSTIGGLVGQVYNISTLNWKVTIVDSYQNGDINSISSDSAIRIGSIIGYAWVTEADIINVINYTSITQATAKINILLSTDFINDFDYDKKVVNVTNFSYSTNLQIWIGTIIHISTSADKKGEIYEGYDAFDENEDENGNLYPYYGIDNEQSVIEVASQLAYLLNSRIQAPNP